MLPQCSLYEFLYLDILRPAIFIQLKIAFAYHAYKQNNKRWQASKSLRSRAHVYSLVHASTRSYKNSYRSL